LVLEMERTGRDSHQVLASDFTLAFILVAGLAASSSLIFARLPKRAGASLSRRAHAVGEAEAQETLEQV